jgi:hypothetical protein
VLIVNLWEHQVGLYQGANMGLLKTVFEVNLNLFGNRTAEGWVSKKYIRHVLKDLKDPSTYSITLCDPGLYWKYPLGESDADIIPGYAKNLGGYLQAIGFGEHTDVRLF